MSTATHTQLYRDTYALSIFATTNFKRNFQSNDFINENVFAQRQIFLPLALEILAEGFKTLLHSSLQISYSNLCALQKYVHYTWHVWVNIEYFFCFATKECGSESIFCRKKETAIYFKTLRKIHEFSSARKRGNISPPKMFFAGKCHWQWRLFDIIGKSMWTTEALNADLPKSNSFQIPRFSLNQRRCSVRWEFVWHLIAITFPFFLPIVFMAG